MRFLFIAFLVLASLNVNAQWDTLNTLVEYKFEGVAFRNGNEGIAVGSDVNGDGKAIYTTDRGATWNYFVGSLSLKYHDAVFTPSGSVYILMDSGRFVHKAFPMTSHISDGFLTTRTLLCGAAPTDSAFYCGGEAGVLFRTFDRGTTWDTLSIGSTETINDIYFDGVANGWVVCEDGYMAMTSDSGNTWTFVPQPMFGFYDIKSIDYQGSLGVNPYIVGGVGTAFFSVDNGANWAGLATGTINTLNKIRFGTNNAGLICGDNGYIFRTENAGWTWFGDTSETNVDLFDIAYAADTTAFICGDSGVILRSNVNISSVQQHHVVSFAAGVYPNPCNGPLNVQLLLNAESDLTVDVLDLTGQIVHTEYHENVSAGQNTMALNMEATAAGVYFVRVSNGYSAVTLRVVMQ